MDNEFSRKREPADASVKGGRFGQAVAIGTQLLEALYRWLFSEVRLRLKPDEEERVSKALETRAKAIREFTLDELVSFFKETGLFEVAERELKRDFSFLEKADVWRDLRIRATQSQSEPEDSVITEDEAKAFLAAVDLCLHQAGLVIEEHPKPTGAKNQEA